MTPWNERPRDHGQPREWREQHEPTGLQTRREGFEYQRQAWEGPRNHDLHEQRWAESVEPRNGNQDQTIAQVDGQRNVAAWKRFEKLVPRLDQGTPIEPWIQDVRRLRPKQSDPEEFWEIMCLHVPANIFEDVMAIWTAADGQGEAKRDKAFSRLRRMLGKHKSAVEAMQTVQNFEKEEDEPATTAIMRFNQLVRDYESMCKEEDVTPVDRNGSR